ncbi:MAG: hypothetical protein LRY67_05295 [Gammaproteobacteria bacterium]|nr:hypothetical protein [Gammaproteobacteria bacterium]
MFCWKKNRVVPINEEDIESNSLSPELLFEKNINDLSTIEKKIPHVEKFFLVLGVFFTFYMAQRNFFGTHDDDDSTQEPLVKYGSMLYNSIPLFITFVIRNAILFRMMRNMSSMLIDYVDKHETNPIRTYKAAMKSSVEKMMTEDFSSGNTTRFYSENFNEIEQAFLTIAVPDSTEKSNAEIFIKKFPKEFDVKNLALTFADVGFFLGINTILLLAVSLSIVFCGFLIKSPSVEKLGEFILGLCLSFLTIMPMVLRNDTLFPLRKKYNDIQDKTNMIIQAERTFLRLTDLLEDQIQASGLGQESDSPRNVSGNAQKLVIPFFKEMVRRQASRSAELYAYEDECKKLCQEFRVFDERQGDISSQTQGIYDPTTLAGLTNRILHLKDPDISLSLDSLKTILLDIKQRLNAYENTSNKESVLAHLDIDTKLERIISLQTIQSQYNSLPLGYTIVHERTASCSQPSL